MTIHSKKKKAVNNYINNQDLYAAMVSYKKEVRKLKKIKEKAPIPNYVGECLLLIAKNLSNHPWFKGYSDHWKQEMISDGVENCVLYLDNFDPKKSKNPFGYFTQITYFSFRRRIDKEKKQQYIRYKNMENYFDLNDSYVGGALIDRELYENNQVFIEEYEKNQLNKKKKSARVKEKGVEKFCGRRKTKR